MCPCHTYSKFSWITPLIRFVIRVRLVEEKKGRRKGEGNIILDGLCNERYLFELFGKKEKRKEGK